MAVSHRASFSLVIGAAAAAASLPFSVARQEERNAAARYWLPRYARGIAASDDNIKLVVLAVAALRWRRDSRIHTGERGEETQRNETQRDDVDEIESNDEKHEQAR